MIRIVAAASEESFRQARQLVTEYAASLGIDLAFQDFDDELARLGTVYGRPEGRLLLASWDERLAGCVGLRRLEPAVAEMKRLYVRPGFRGKGIGKALAIASVNEARSLGYRRMRLDTLPSMADAIRLYESLGFQAISPYRFNQIAGTRFMELVL